MKRQSKVLNAYDHKQAITPQATKSFNSLNDLTVIILSHKAQNPLATYDHQPTSTYLLCRYICNIFVVYRRPIFDLGCGRL